MKKIIKKALNKMKRFIRSRSYYGKRIFQKTNTIYAVKSIIKKTHFQISKESQNNIIRVGDGSFICEITIEIHGKRNNITIMNNCLLENKAIIEIIGSDNDIYIGRNVRLNGTYISVCSNGSSLSIGDRTYMSTNTGIGISEKTNIKIGNDFLCAGNTRIRSSDGHIIKSNGIQTNKGKDIIIEDHVWVCPNCMVLKGSYISRDSVVGAYSIVNKEFHKPGVLLVGSPAKIAKENIDWER